jgi:site-specific DNA recombinase
MTADRVFCAIYTRKSTSEGLDGDFTSLDAQREAGLSYIASQKGQGWVALPQVYDDGGFTGANIERPSLQKLLEDIKAGGINCVVVYKVDRLSRSLTDFAKLLEFFETHKVTFVSVTQHFNTQNSMGRLTLNILLSFAQFEREIISERTKDKVSAARKKGRWLGGVPMLGYDVDKIAKALVPNKKEVGLVREAFDIYLQKRSLIDTANTLNARGHKTKRHSFEEGRQAGGKPFTKNDVATILNNYTYIGKVKYAGEIYDGVHKAIVSVEVFDRAQKLLAGNRVQRSRPGNAQDASLLRHILWCADCKTRMLPTYSSKKNTKYRYYVCHRAQSNGYQGCPTRSANAQAIETAVVEKVSWLLDNIPELKSKTLVLNTPMWELLFPQERRRVMNLLVRSAEYQGQSKKIALELNQEGIQELERELV